MKNAIPWLVLGIFFLVNSGCRGDERDKDGESEKKEKAISDSGIAPGTETNTHQDMDATVLLRQEGLRVLNGLDEDVRLKGVNLGGWLMWEAWIWGGFLNVLDMGKNSETHILESLTDLVGTDATEQFRQDVYRRYINEKDIERIAALGYNNVRVPINHRLLERDAFPMQYADSGWEILDDLVSWCEKHRVYLVIDLHSAPGGQSDMFVTDPEETNLWESNDHEERTIALWKAVAERYHNRGRVAGYDLLNEPQVVDGNRLISLYRRIIEAIRSVDSNHMIFIEGNWSATIFDIFKNKLAENTVYSFHQYSFSLRDLDSDLATYVELAQTQKIPLWAGEYGEDSAEWVGKMTDKYRETPEVIGWAIWTWKRTNTGHPVIQHISIPDSWKRVVDWITTPATSPRPSVAETRVGFAEFLSAVDLDNCVQNDDYAAITQ